MRVGYGTILFNAFTIGVQNGVVTLGGMAYGPSDKDSAVSMVENYPGVKDVVDNIEVAPVSPMDDRIRLAVARAIYGFPQLNKYAIDPAKPIRITVVNGNVTLSGVVDSQADKEVANIRANGVPGVFKVVNRLEVVGEGAEKSEKLQPQQEIPHSTSLRAGSSGMTTRKTGARAKAKADPPPAAKDDNQKAKTTATVPLRA